MNLDRSARPILFPSPFFRRLFLPYLILMWLGIGAAGIFGAAHLRNSYLESTTQALATEARLVADLIDEHLQRNQIPELRQQINRLGGMTGRRLTIIAADGKVIADNEADVEKMENHRTRQEIVAAASQGEGSSIRPSATLHTELLYFARRGQTAAGDVYFIRLAGPLLQLH